MSAREARRLKITQVKSAIGEPERIRATLRALGIKRHQHSIEHGDSPAIRGMVARVHHLVKIEEA